MVYFYWVEDVDIYGVSTMHGPVSVEFSVPTAVRVAGLETKGGRSMAPMWWLLAVVSLLLAGMRITYKSCTKETNHIP
jgi:hypothetical protein